MEIVKPLDEFTSYLTVERGSDWPKAVASLSATALRDRVLEDTRPIVDAHIRGNEVGILTNLANAYPPLENEYKWTFILGEAGQQ